MDMIGHSDGITETSQRPSYDVAIVTTAALPWRTGPSFLSLWHACGLSDLGLRVAYVIPWLSEASQKLVWNMVYFHHAEEQYEYLRQEASRLGCPALPDFFFYRGRYSSFIRSIIPLQDVFSAIPSTRVIVLEEPEHLTWYPATRRRRAVKAETIIGVVMTNYEYYVRSSLPPGLRWLGILIAGWHRRLIRRHTDLAVPLSPAVSLEGMGHPYREGRITGVLAPYAEVPPVEEETDGIYFLGRLVWDKGLDILIEIACQSGRSIDIYGDGPDAGDIARVARERGAKLRFLGPSASPWTFLKKYRVFLNPSMSEVLCTATADALVAGRHVVLPICPGNTPFFAYPNTHGYSNLHDAVTALEAAMKKQPVSPVEIRHDFDWRTACRNLMALSGETAINPENRFVVNKNLQTRSI